MINDKTRTQDNKQFEDYELIKKLYNFITKSGNVSPFYLDLINSPDKLWGSDQTAEFLNVEPNDDMTYNFSDWFKQVKLANGLNRANQIRKSFQNVLEGKEKDYSVKYQMFDKNGRKRWYHSLSKIIERDEHGNPTDVYGLNIDIDELVRSQEQLRELKRQSITDELTGLYNIKYLRKYIDEISKKENCVYLLTYANIKNFRRINEIYGYDFGDKVLEYIGAYFKNNPLNKRTYFRDSGDEFVIVSTDDNEISTLLNNCENELKPYKLDFEVEGQSIRIEFNMAHVLYPQHTSDRDEIVNFAKETLFLAKQHTTKDMLLFNGDIHETVKREKEIINDFRNSDIMNEFEMYYQKIVNLVNPETEIVEALVRWNHPKKGFMRPNDFLDILTKSNLIVDLYLPMFEKCLKQLNKWEKLYGKKIDLSYNISSNVMMLETLYDSLNNVLEKYEVEASRIHLELTESMFINNNPLVMKNIRMLRYKGFKLSIDDFGTGFSSLSRIKDFDYDMIKIDKVFARDYKNETTKIIINMIKELAKEKGASCTIEGVETEAQLNMFADLGIEYVQGYYFNKPMKAEDMSKYMF